MKTRAAVLVELKKPLVLDELEIPALTFGQVLVKVLCSGICGAQINEIDGAKGPDKFLPHLLGHEATAEVLEVGPAVKSVKAGDRVVMHWRKGAGLEVPPPKYASKSLGPVNAGWVTTFNEHAIVSENRVTRVPSDFDPEAGALMGCAVTTAFGVINNNAHLKVGESIVIFGAGGVGLNVVQGAAMVAAHPIVAIDLFDNKLQLAKSLGATHLINSTQTNAEEEILRIVGPGGADVTVDNTGNPRVIELAYRVTSARGRTVLVGVPKKGENVNIYTLPIHFEKTLHGSHGGDALPQYDIPNYVKLIQAGKLSLKEIIGKRYAFDQINDAIADMRSGAVAGRCMIHMAGG